MLENCKDGKIMSKIAVIIPCYNEAVSIIKVLESFVQYISTNIYLLKQDIDIYVYDNNSTDNTTGLVSKYIMVFKEVYQGNYKVYNVNLYLRYCTIQGKGNTIRQAFKDIDADCYTMIDGDNTYGIEYFADMCKAILLDGFYMTVGDRLHNGYFSENKRLFHNKGNIIVRNWINKLYNVHYNDILSGFRCFNQAYIKGFNIEGGGFTLETEMSAYAALNHLKVKEFATMYRDRQGSTSKLRTIPDGIKVIRMLCILSIRKIYKDKSGRHTV